MQIRKLREWHTNQIVMGSVTLRVACAIAVVFALTSCASPPQKPNCDLPNAIGIDPNEEYFRGTWFNSQSFEDYREWKKCTFELDGSFLCEENVRGPIDKENTMFEVHQHWRHGEWAISGTKFTYFLEFEVEATSQSAFVLVNKAGYKEVFYKTEQCTLSQ